jgi:septation ring formation regulator EzrA
LVVERVRELLDVASRHLERAKMHALAVVGEVGEFERYLGFARKFGADKESISHWIERLDKMSRHVNGLKDALERAKVMLEEALKAL